MVFSLVVPMALQNLVNVGVGMTDTMMTGLAGERRPFPGRPSPTS